MISLWSMAFNVFPWVKLYFYSACVSFLSSSALAWGVCCGQCHLCVCRWGCPSVRPSTRPMWFAMLLRNQNARFHTKINGLNKRAEFVTKMSFPSYINHQCHCQTLIPFWYHFPTFYHSFFEEYTNENIIESQLCTFVCKIWKYYFISEYHGVISWSFSYFLVFVLLLLLLLMLYIYIYIERERERGREREREFECLSPCNSLNITRSWPYF